MSLLSEFKAEHLKLNASQFSKVNTREHIPNLIFERALFFDAWLQKFWHSQDLMQENLMQNNTPAHTSWNKKLCLVAVGGYGRGELHPYSDIDVLILIDDASDASDAGDANISFDEITAKISEFITSLWDMKLSIGHSVRTLAQTLEEAKTLAVATSLLETRLIAGSQLLYARLKELIDGPIFGLKPGNNPKSFSALNTKILWDKKLFFKAKNEELINRHAHYQDALYNLEPNIKNGPGGLRDLHTMMWLMKHYANGNNEDWLIQNNVLTQFEFDELHQCRNFLWSIRFALHIYHKTADERLSFDAQRQITLWQGKRQPYTQDMQGTQNPQAMHASNADIESFMQGYYRIIAILNRLSNIVLNYLNETLFYQHNAEAISINAHFQSRNGFLENRSQSIFNEFPHTIFTLFSILHEHSNIKGIHSETLRDISKFAMLMNDDIRQNALLKKAFIAIWKKGEGLTHTLRKLHRYGILENYLPDFATICGRMQFDLFHAYTVDQHALMSVRNTRRLAMSRFAHENPHGFDVMQKIKDQHIVYLAAFLHDIGKGRPENHATLGAKIAQNFCHNHNLSAYETRLITWLVENHLIMSDVAQKKDIADPEEIKHFINIVGTQERLNCLYVLTISDISATNPKLLNAWRRNLLKKLYEDSLSALAKGRTFLVNLKDNALIQLKALKISEAHIFFAWKQLPEGVFQRYSIEYLTQITRMILKKKNDNKPWISVRHKDGITEITIYVHQSDHHLKVITKCLSNLNLSILEAKIIQCNNGYSVFIFNTSEAQFSTHIDKKKPKQAFISTQNKLIQTKLVYAIAHPSIKSNSFHVTQHSKAFGFDAKILFGTDSDQGHTVFELIASDKVGLLSDISSIFNQLGIVLHHAKINTFGARAEDIFFISNRDNKPLTHYEKTQLKDVLLEYLND